MFKRVRPAGRQSVLVATCLAEAVGSAVHLADHAYILIHTDHSRSGYLASDNHRPAAVFNDCGNELGWKLASTDKTCAVRRASILTRFRNCVPPRVVRWLV